MHRGLEQRERGGGGRGLVELRSPEIFRRADLRAISCACFDYTFFSPREEL